MRINPYGSSSWSALSNFEVLSRESIIHKVCENGLFLEHLDEEFRSDKEVVLAAVIQNPFAFEYASKELQNDKELVIQAYHYSPLSLQFAGKEALIAVIEKNSEALEYASEELKNNEEVILFTLRKNWDALRFAGRELMKNKEFIISLLGRLLFSLSIRYHVRILIDNMSDEFRNDKDVMLAAVSLDGYALEDASEGLKNDKEVVIAAIRKNAYALQYASDELKGDKSVVLEAVEKVGCLLKYASDDLKKDKDVVLACIESSAEALEFASQELKNDKEVILKAVSKSGEALQHASDDLKRDKEVFFAAFKQDYRSIRLASSSLLADKDTMLAAIKINGYALNYASDELKRDKDVVLAAVMLNPLALEYASDELKNDEEIAFTAICKSSSALQYAGDEMKNNKALVCLAVRNNGYVLRHASEELKNNKEVVLVAVSSNGGALRNASHDLKNCKEVVLAAVKENGMALEYASEELKNDQEVVLAAVRRTFYAIRFANPSLKNDPEIINAIIYGGIDDHECLINGKRYFPKPLSQELKILELPKLSEDATVEHLKVSLSSFIDSLYDFVGQDIVKLNEIRKELGLECVRPLDDLPIASDLIFEKLNECVIKLRSYHESLFNRVANKKAYLGTPPEGDRELVKFYDQIEFHLRHLDSYFSKQENQLPEALVERMQLLQSQSGCGARFQAETQQLFSLYCIPTDSMSIDKQLAIIASSQAKKAIEAITPNRDSHEINIKTFQLDPFLVGSQTTRDHLGHLFDQKDLMIQFLGYHTSKNLIETIQRVLKPGTELEATFRDYLKENFLPDLTESDIGEISLQIEDAWQSKKEITIHRFRRYLQAKAENNLQIERFFKLPDDEAACASDEELLKLIETKKIRFIENTFKQDAIGTQISKLYSKYFDQEANRWNPLIIAKALEKMGILEVVK